MKFTMVAQSGELNADTTTHVLNAIMEIFKTWQMPARIEGNSIETEWTYSVLTENIISHDICSFPEVVSMVKSPPDPANYVFLR